MRSLIGSEEAKLVLALMHKKKEVPDELRAKAIEQLKVLSMACESGSAQGYLLDKLTQAIDENDIDAAIEVAEMAGAVLGNEVEADDNLHIDINPLIKDNVKQAVDKFVDTLGEDNVPREAALHILEKASEQLFFVPFEFADSLLIGFSGKYDCIVVFGVNCEEDKAKITDRFFNASWRFDVLNKIKDGLQIDGDLDVAFMSLRYRLIDEKSIELVIRGL